MLEAENEFIIADLTNMKNLREIETLAFNNLEISRLNLPGQLEYFNINCGSSVRQVRLPDGMDIKKIIHYIEEWKRFKDDRKQLVIPSSIVKKNQYIKRIHSDKHIIFEETGDNEERLRILRRAQKYKKE